MIERYEWRESMHVMRNMQEQWWLTIRYMVI